MSYTRRQILRSVQFYKREIRKHGRVKTPYGPGLKGSWALLDEAATIIQQLMRETRSDR